MELSKQRRWQIKQKLLGNCIICGKLRINSTYCQFHLDYYRSYRKLHKRLYKSIREISSEERKKRNLSSKKYQQSHREKRTEYFRKYRQSKKGKLAIKKAVTKYELSHPERKKAWSKVKKLPNLPCIKCERKAHKHHPNPLEPFAIIYLCPLHHKEVHMV